MASDLTTNADLASKNVFERNLATSTTQLVSIAATGTNSGNNTSDMPNQTLVNASQQSTGTISSDGQYVVFESLATDLVPNFVQQNGGASYGYDIYLRDTIAGTTTLLSHDVSADANGGNGISGTATMTPDGSYVAFQSTSSNLVALDTNGQTDVFVATTNAAVTKDSLGVYSGGYWYIDVNGTTQVVGVPSSWASATPITGDWNGTGKTEIGLFNNATATWWLNTAGDGVFKTSETFAFGFGGSGVVPVVGDWNGAGKSEVGVYANGAWFRDVDGSHTWDATNAAAVAYLGWNDGGTHTVIPVPGNWAGNGSTQMGVYCQGVWFLDSTDSNKWDGSHTYWGWAGTLAPVVGNWTGSSTKSQFGVYNQGAWFLDYDNSHLWDATNQAALTFYGWAGRSLWWAFGAAGFRRQPRRRHPASSRRGSGPRRSRRLSARRLPAGRAIWHRRPAASPAAIRTWQVASNCRRSLSRRSPRQRRRRCLRRSIPRPWTGSTC